MVKKIFAFCLAILLPYFFGARIFAKPSFSSHSPSTLSQSSLSAQSAILIEAHGGKVLFEKNARKKMGMASTTKIMTALVVAQSCDTNERVVIDERAVGIEGSSIYMRTGEILTVEQLLYALLLASANDAAVALALHVSDSVEAFAVKMNDYAAKLGLCDTHFVNPHGLYDDAHYTTAYDLSLIAKAALENETLKKIASTYKTTIPSSDGTGVRVLVNHNKMLRLYDGTIGVKTGFTKKTGRTLVSAAERDGLTLIAVTLNAPSDWNDHTIMLDHGFENYTRVTLFAAGEFRYALEISGGTDSFVVLTNADNISLTLKKESYSAKTTVETHCRFICAPIRSGTEIGRVSVECGTESISSPLIALSDVDSKKRNGIF